MQKSQVLFKKNLKSISLNQSLSFLVYDKALLKYSPDFKIWQKQFKFQYAVKAGESLKALSQLDAHLKHILKISSGMNTREMQFVVVGGGSVGDFGGFVASIFKRGVRLVHIPSTWLAAIDSAHGGKTALNVGGTKNQIGTFYPPEKVFIVDNLLLAQPEKRAVEACGELIKMALIDNGSWTQKLARATSSRDALRLCLKPAILSKYKIVAKDPLEKNGMRQILNLGHTWGHVLESSLALPHGTAILAGLQFCLNWSLNRQILKSTDYEKASRYLRAIPTYQIKRIKKSQALQFLLQDKKKNSQKTLNFIFLRGLGQASRERVTIQDIINEASRQGWITI